MKLNDVVNNAKKRAIKNFVKGLTVIELLNNMDDTFKDNVRDDIPLEVNICLNFFNKDLEVIQSSFVCDYETVKGIVNHDEKILSAIPKTAELLNKTVVNLYDYDTPKVIYGYNNRIPVSIRHILNIIVED